MDNLEMLYENMIKEASKTGTVDTGKEMPKPNESFEGSDKAKKMSSESGPDGKSNKVNKPVAGPSVGDASFEEGKGKPLSKKEGKVAESKEESGIALSFDELYSKTLNEEEDAIAPAADIESEDFSEDTGDFAPEGEEGDIDEEIDVASELRLLADRLSEIADKLSVDETGGVEEEPVDEIPAEGEGEEDMGGVGSDIIGNESVQHRRKVVKEAIKSEPTPKPLKKTTLGPKMSQNPKNKIGKSGAGKASTPSAKDRTGTPSNLPKTQFGPKMSQNPSGTGPAVKGSNAPLVA
jgi:hypothetical protein